MVAESIAQSLRETCEVAGLLYDGADVLPWLSANRVEFILLDINLPRRSGLEVLKAVRRTGAKAKVLCYSMERGGIWSERVRSYGGDGFVCKDESTKTLLLAITTILHGGQWFPGSGGKLVQSRLEPSISLSARKVQICQAVANGLSTEAIAEVLGVSPETVAEHLDGTRAHLGAANRAELVRKAIAHGFVSALDSSTNQLSRSILT